ncbi:MAG: hypothetical protein M3406_17870 [Chloroflexota bacterium]|nr:hypothetical protein [Chloroflexota bacterium]
MTRPPTAHGWELRIGGMAAVVGSLLAMVGNLLHPMTPVGDPAGVGHAIHASQSWTTVHMVIVIGLALMLGGLVAIADSMRTGLAGALSRFGLFAAVSGATLGMILVTLDGIAAKQLADAWAGAPAAEQAAALRDLVAEETMNFALVALFNILFAGFTFILYGLAVATGDVYPRWLGWPVVVAGIGSIAVGLIQGQVGESTGISRIASIVFPTVITLWVATLGILLLRRQPLPESQES